MRFYDGFPKYVSVAERRAKAEKRLKKLMKKNPDMNPVIIEGTAIAKTWWGKEWNKNLERYADYANRIARGRSYVRHRGVLDLKIAPGRVEALVSGSEPYSVTIDIEKIPDTHWSDIKKACKGDMENIQELMAGKFPKKLADLFTQKGKGLFPSPKEIDFSCSCPDSAYMCKHVAAVLYGIGARLDDDPSLFFDLRQADMDDLITETVQESRYDILEKSDRASSRVIEEEVSLSEMFGIALDDEEKSSSPPPSKKRQPKKKTGAKKVGGKSAEEKKNTRKSASPKKRPVKSGKGSSAGKGTKIGKRAKTEKTSKPASAMSDIDRILNVLAKGKKAMPVAEVIASLDLPDQKVRNILYRLKIEGKVENPSRGVYHLKH